MELEALLPPASMPAAVANDRIGTIGDLALAAFDAGVGDLIYVVFPDEPASASKEIFGEWLPTRPVKLEYKATYAAHRAFLQGLLRRRDRGPFYTVDSIDVARPSALRRAKSDDPAAGDGADTSYRAESSEILVAKVTLRRILPRPDELDERPTFRGAHDARRRLDPYQGRRYRPRPSCPPHARCECHLGDRGENCERA